MSNFDLCFNSMEFTKSLFLDPNSIDYNPIDNLLGVSKSLFLCLLLKKVGLLLCTWGSVRWWVGISVCQFPTTSAMNNWRTWNTIDLNLRTLISINMLMINNAWQVSVLRSRSSRGYHFFTKTSCNSL